MASESKGGGAPSHTHIPSHPAVPAPRRRVGIVGYGKLGQYLVEKILTDPVVSSKLELAFVWNRSPDALVADDRIPKEKRCMDLEEDVERFEPDLIVEVAHPDISEEYGAGLIEVADYMVGSPVVFADRESASELIEASRESGNGIYIPSGALWGAQDIRKMAELGTLKGLALTMKFEPSALKLEGALAEKLEKYDGGGELVLYEGPVRDLAPMAPRNVNTMAAACLAGYNLGFDKVQGKLITDAKLDAHVIHVDVTGPGPDDAPFTVRTTRTNPAKKGAVTGNATFAAFLSSMLKAGAQGAGVHMV